MACIRRDAAWYYQRRDFFITAHRMMRIAGQYAFAVTLMRPEEQQVKPLAAVQLSRPYRLGVVPKLLIARTATVFFFIHCFTFPARFELQLLFQTVALPSVRHANNLFFQV